MLTMVRDAFHSLPSFLFENRNNPSEPYHGWRALSSEGSGLAQWIHKTVLHPPRSRCGSHSIFPLAFLWIVHGQVIQWTAFCPRRRRSFGKSTEIAIHRSNPQERSDGVGIWGAFRCLHHSFMDAAADYG